MVTLNRYNISYLLNGRWMESARVTEAASWQDAIIRWADIRVEDEIISETPDADGQSGIMKIDYIYNDTGHTVRTDVSASIIKP